MKTANKILLYQTKGEFDFIDVSQEIEGFVKETGIKNGLVNVQTLHTTAAVILNENEPLLLEDFKAHLARLLSKDLSYQHDDFSKRVINMCQDECRNGHSHCLALHLPPNITLNLIEDKLQFGQWQRIFLVELDRARPRKLQIQVIGE